MSNDEVVGSVSHGGGDVKGLRGGVLGQLGPDLRAAVLRELGQRPFLRLGRLEGPPGGLGHRHIVLAALAPTVTRRPGKTTSRFEAGNKNNFIANGQHTSVFMVTSPPMGPTLKED